MLDGPLHVGAEVEILPKGLRARVRGLQTHQQQQEVALPGTRVAVNLAGVSHRDLARGDVLALPGRLRPTDLLDVQLRLIPAAPQPLVQNARLDLFVGATEVPCRVTLLDRDELRPGETGWLQLRLARPIAVARGDRYILRLPSPSRTLGGGMVVDTHPPRHRRFRAEVIAALEALARGTPTDLLRRALSDGEPHAWPVLLQASGLTMDAGAAGLAELVASGEAIILGDSDRRSEIGDSSPQSLGADLQSRWVLSASGWATLCNKVTAALQSYHRRYPLRMGMPREELRSRLRLSSEGLEALLTTAAARRLVVVQGSSVRLPAHVPTLAPEQERAARRLLEAFAATPYSPPAPDLDAEVLGWLVEQGKIVRVSADVAFLPATYTEMVDWVREQIRRTGEVTVAQFRDRFKTSRKYALALLEHLDERKITRRLGDVRVLY